MKKHQDSVNTKKILLSVKRFPVKNYDNFDLDRLVVYALYFLEKKKVPLYFDFISIGLFRLFPQKFSMANFNQYPDTNRISKALRRLTDQKRKRWATGNVENGFSLTDLGRETANQVSNFLKNPKLKKVRVSRVVAKSRGRSFDDDVHDIQESETFRKWKEGQEVNNYEFFAFLKASPHTPKQLLVKHLEYLKNSVAAVKNKEILKFLIWLEAKFHNLLY